MHAVSYVFGREEEGTVLVDIEAVLCECIFYKIIAKYGAFRKFSSDSCKVSFIFLKRDI